MSYQFSLSDCLLFNMSVAQFMEECMKVAFRMFLPPYGFQARVGALYLLHGLYFTQPCLPTVKVSSAVTVSVSD